MQLVHALRTAQPVSAPTRTRMITVITAVATLAACRGRLDWPAPPPPLACRVDVHVSFEGEAPRLLLTRYHHRDGRIAWMRADDGKIIEDERFVYADSGALTEIVARRTDPEGNLNCDIDGGCPFPARRSITRVVAVYDAQGRLARLERSWTYYSERGENDWERDDHDARALAISYDARGARHVTATGTMTDDRDRNGPAFDLWGRLVVGRAVAAPTAQLADANLVGDVPAGPAELHYDDRGRVVAIDHRVDRVVGGELQASQRRATYTYSPACDVLAPPAAVEAPSDAVCITTPFGRVRHCF